MENILNKWNVHIIITRLMKYAFHLHIIYFTTTFLFLQDKKDEFASIVLGLTLKGMHIYQVHNVSTHRISLGRIQL